jgi:hypothetical protein
MAVPVAESEVVPPSAIFREYKNIHGSESVSEHVTVEVSAART